jgi:CBS domain-containing membrane protein
MSIFSFTNFTQFIPPAGNLTFKDSFVCVIASFMCIFVVVISSTCFKPNAPILLASMGASLIILLLAPVSPFAQPWSFFCGHLVSAFVGMTCALTITPFWLASSLAVSVSIFAMLCLRCLHPPGAATALVPVIGGATFIELGYKFILTPVLLNVSVMLIMVIIVNRWCLKRDYPQSFKPIIPVSENRLSQQDVQQALKKGGEFIDVNIKQLHELLLSAEQQKLERLHGEIICADIMTKDILAVEYGEEVEIAWQKMHHEKLKAIPVVDKANRVIGIVTWADFFKFVEMSPYVSFQEKFLAFIRRTPDVTTNKPEVVGHLMNKQVVVLSETAPINDLIYLFSSQKHQQIPIVNDENRLVGMVFQTDLITALNDKILST